jgi:hypothetical protein
MNFTLSVSGVKKVMKVIDNHMEMSQEMPAQNVASVISARPRRSRWAIWFGIINIVLSFVFLGLFFVFPFVPLSASLKVICSIVSLILGHVLFLVGIAFIGTTIVKRYYRYLNPICWFRHNRSVTLK